jgi:hypothetical protein
VIESVWLGLPGDMSIEEPEKAQERYDRVLSSTIMGLGAYIGITHISLHDLNAVHIRLLA